MILEGKVKKLKIIIGEEDRVYQRPLFEAIIFAAKKYKIAGATVTRGIISYGADSIVNNVKVFNLSDKKPIVIEMIDRPERILDFSEIVTRLVYKSESGGIIFTEDVDVLLYANSVLSKEKEKEN
ncbi:DUF190 domain-containing protein [Marinilabiliaceae bacterium JC017]|nr:DUF190 domain-containing protein [Marinilabiliaceae bacterium JC017]